MVRGPHPIGFHAPFFSEDVIFGEDVTPLALRPKALAWPLY
jgi:hypothetical protein